MDFNFDYEKMHLFSKAIYQIQSGAYHFIIAITETIHAGFSKIFNNINAPLGFVVSGFQ